VFADALQIVAICAHSTRSIAAACGERLVDDRRRVADS
jgi:hypothetical protein